LGKSIYALLAEYWGANTIARLKQQRINSGTLNP
jgi:hypothetical protein